MGALCYDVCARVLFNSFFHSFPKIWLEKKHIATATETATIIYSCTERRFGFKTKVEHNASQPKSVCHILIDQCMWLIASDIQSQVWELLPNCQRELRFKSMCRSENGPDSKSSSCSQNNDIKILLICLVRASVSVCFSNEIDYRK